jgi:hypothetical protein
MTDYRAWIAGKRSAAWQRAGHRDQLYPGVRLDHVCTWCDADTWVCEEVAAEPVPDAQQLDLFEVA